MEGLLRRNFATILSIVAIIVGLISLGMGLQMSCTLERTAKLLSRLEQRTELVEATSAWNWAVWNLSAEEWPHYLKKMQITAAYSSPRYVEPLPGDKFALTDEGRKLLETKHMERIATMLGANKDLPENKVLLRLGIDELYSAAKKKEVKFDVMLGVVASYVQEIKQR